MTPLLQGKLALVTGAASGIGHAIARAYGEHGARVIAVDLHLPSHAPFDVTLDVTDVEGCNALAARVRRDFGDIDVLVNSAGILVREGIDSPRAHQVVQEVMNVNLHGTFNMIHAFLPSLRASRGCIVNIASGAALRAQPGCAGYSASKGAVKMLTQSMAVDLGKDGIRVNAVAPGVIDTPMTQATRSDPQRLARFVSNIPLGRIGQAEEIAGPAVFLASSMASFVNGVTLLADGGAQA